MLISSVFQNSTKTDANLSLQLLSTLHTILYSIVSVSYTHLKAGQKAHLGDAVDVVAKAREGLSRRQLEDGGSGEGAFYFQAVLQDQDDGVDPEQAQQAHDDSEDVVPDVYKRQAYHWARDEEK